MGNEKDPNWIDASPTKEFFIEMLVKDIPLERSIIDLVDNCVDGALRLRGSGSLEGLWVRIELDEESFRIADSCGGITVDLARRYAFRFGRPEGMQSTLRSVGQFGVGMKRALFKLGERFEVRSTTDSTTFVVVIDVNEWKKKEKDWEFGFQEYQEDLSEVPQDKRGTIIEVTSLHESVSESFGLENFRTGLIQELQSAHTLNIEKGLSITLNGIPLEIRPLALLQSNELEPAYREMTFNKVLPSTITVRMYAGVSESKPADAGWYVFCNGRMVLEADQTITTGWGEVGGRRIPKYHNQFAMFRGYAFFDSDHASLLPWNTTKTGVDTDSPRFRRVRLEMIALMRPVIDFLNKVDAEKQGEGDRPLEAALGDAKSTKLSDVEGRKKFAGPKPAPSRRPPRTGRILYHRPYDQIERVKEHLKVHTNREVGEITFDYYLEMECDE